MKDPVAWSARVLAASPPTVLYHATTPKKLARYRATGTILPPVRGFDSRKAAEEWARPKGRTIICAVTPTPGAVYPLPDHHLPSGLAWWCAAIDGYEVSE